MGDLAATALFWRPVVRDECVLRGLRDLGVGEGMAIAVAGPRHRGIPLDSDAPYGLAALDLRGGPVVVELPPGRYTGVVRDRHGRRVCELEAPGAHLVLPPGRGAGCSGTHRAILSVRAWPAGGDLAAALDALRRVRVHPLDRPDAVLAHIDVSALSADFGCPDFGSVLREVLRDEPDPSLVPDTSLPLGPEPPGAVWRDTTGALLDGGVNYRLRVRPPLREFWSVTVHDSGTRSQVRTDQDRAALRSHVELAGLTGPADLFIGPAPPVEHAHDRWIKTVPDITWFARFRTAGRTACPEAIERV